MVTNSTDIVHCPYCTAPVAAPPAIAPRARAGPGEYQSWTGIEIVLAFVVVPLLVAGSVLALIAPAVTPVLVVGLGVSAIALLIILLAHRRPPASPGHGVDTTTELQLGLHLRRRSSVPEAGAGAAQERDRQIPTHPPTPYQHASTHLGYQPALGNRRATFHRPGDLPGGDR